MTVCRWVDLHYTAKMADTYKFTNDLHAGLNAQEMLKRVLVRLGCCQAPVRDRRRVDNDEGGPSLACRAVAVPTGGRYVLLHCRNALKIEPGRPVKSQHAMPAAVAAPRLARYWSMCPSDHVTLYFCSAPLQERSSHVPDGPAYRAWPALPNVSVGWRCRNCNYLAPFFKSLSYLFQVWVNSPKSNYDLSEYGPYWAKTCASGATFDEDSCGGDLQLVLAESGPLQPQEGASNTTPCDESDVSHPGGVFGMPGKRVTTSSCAHIRWGVRRGEMQ